ncbi:MAG TPA: helix-turn-helix domain-containing protein [Jatrophihabitans sp.]
MPDTPVGVSLGSRVRAVLDRMDADVARTLVDLGIDGYRPGFSAVIRFVTENETVTIGDLARGTGITHSAASQRVSEMRRRGLVELAEGSDGRERIIRLTAAARALRPALDAEWDATSAAFDALNSELTASLSQVVEEMNAALDRRSFRDRIADAAAGLPGLDPEHRRIITGTDRA